jgi:valyl-tRNA synthetase
LESAISDVEVENLEIQGKTEIAVPNYDKNVTFGLITDISYKVVDSDEEIVVSTTRPETLLGDVAVAVHPNDTRYSHLRNALLWHPYRQEAIPLIFDESVDPEFGTGAVKITPAHDKNDFDVGKRHKLRNVQVITEKGLIVDEFQDFAGLPRFTAREKILNNLAERQLHRGTKSHNMILPICSRSKDVIEFLLRPQWFVRCEEMSKKAVEVVKNGELKIHPQQFEKEWFRWLKNCHDWCISRQLWWGHQIPAYKINNEKWIAAKSPEEAAKKFNGKVESIERDQDVLDTWFSSGLLPFSVFNWPNESEESKKFFPLSLMETGHDILFFWVARMVMLSMELTGNVPFKEVLLHGIICDSYGRKMSKSLGNVISPDHIIHGATLEQLKKEVEESVARGILSQSELEKTLQGQRQMFNFGIKECGVDALRFTLLSQNVKQHFISFDIIDAFTNSKFFNKIFNATRFANGIAEVVEVVIKDIETLDGLKLSDMDRWLLSRLANTVKIVNKSIENNNFHLAIAALKSFFYDDLCNVYVETAKINRLKLNPELKVNCYVLNTCLAIGLDQLEIFAPFLAHELKKYVATSCIVDLESFIDVDHEKRIKNLLEICEDIREMKAHCRITKKILSEMQILIKSTVNEEFLRSQVDNIKALTFTDDLVMTTNVEEFESEDFIALSTAGHLCSFGIRTLDKSEGKFDTSLNKKKFFKLESELANLIKVVSQEGYQMNAKDNVKLKHKEKIEKLKTEIENIRQMSC